MRKISEMFLAHMHMCTHSPTDTDRHTQLIGPKDNALLSNIGSGSTASKQDLALSRLPSSTNQSHVQNGGQGWEDVVNDRLNSPEPHAGVTCRHKHKHCSG